MVALFPKPCPAAIRMLIVDGWSMTNGALALGMHRSTFVDHRNRLGLGRFVPNYFKPISTAEFRREWADQNQRLDDIAARHGREKQSLQRLAARLGLPKRKGGRKVTVGWPSDFNAMWDAGISSAEIGKRIGCVRTSVIKEAIRRGLSGRAKPWSPKMTMAEYVMQAAVARMAAEGRAHARATIAFGRSLLEAEEKPAPKVPPAPPPDYRATIPVSQIPPRHPATEIGATP